MEDALTVRVRGDALETEPPFDGLPATPENAVAVKQHSRDNGLRLLADRQFRYLLTLGESNGEQPAIRMADAWDHQLRMLAWMRAHEEAWILEAWMGTGKSKAVIDHVQNTPAIRRVLVVTLPAAVTDVWPQQIERHAALPALCVALGDGKPLAKRQEIAQTAVAQADERLLFVAINYEAFWREPFASWLLKAKPFDLVVYDESHKLKTPSGRASKFAHKLSKVIPRRGAMTGTLAPHSPLDVFGQCRAVDDRLFGPYITKFRARYAITNPRIPQMILRWRNEDEIRAILDRVRYVVPDTVLDLPPETHNEVWVDLPAQAMRHYRELELEFYTRVGTGEITASNALVQVTRLQQAAQGSAPDTEGNVVEIHRAKERALADLIESAAGEPFVVFGKFHSDLDQIARAAKAAGATCAELSGRVKQLREWNAGDYQVIACQTQAAGAAIDLTRARYCAYYAQTHLGDYDQSRTRVRRPGQTRPVTYYHVLARNTVDARMRVALDERRDVIAEVLKGAKHGKGEGQGKGGKGSV